MGGGGGGNVYLSCGDGDCLLILPRQPGKIPLLFFEFQLPRGSFTCARRFISAEKIQSVYPESFLTFVIKIILKKIINK